MSEISTAAKKVLKCHGQLAVHQTPETPQQQKQALVSVRETERFHDLLSSPTNVVAATVVNY